MTGSHRPAIQTPTSGKLVKTLVDSNPQNSTRSAQQMAAIALSMSGQLVVAVVAPVLFGHWLDQRYHKASFWTIIGLVVSIAGMIAVVIQANRQINEYMQTNTKKDTDK